MKETKKKCNICDYYKCLICNGHIMPEVPNQTQHINSVVIKHALEAGVMPGAFAVDKCNCIEHRN